MPFSNPHFTLFQIPPFTLFLPTISHYYTPFLHYFHPPLTLCKPPFTQFISPPLTLSQSPFPHFNTIPAPLILHVFQPSRGWVLTHPCSCYRCKLTAWDGLYHDFWERWALAIFQYLYIDTICIYIMTESQTESKMSVTFLFSMWRGWLVHVDSLLDCFVHRVS